MQELLRAVIHFGLRNHMRADLQRVEHGGDRRQAGAEQARIRSILEGGQDLGGLHFGRALRAAIIHLAHQRVLLVAHERGGGVDRRDHRAGFPVGLVQGLGGESFGTLSH